MTGETVTSTPALGNLAQSPQAFSYAEHVQRLLETDFSAITPSEASQGEIIMDKFVGMLFANDGATNNHNQHFSPKNVLDLMDKAPESLKTDVDTAFKDHKEEVAGYFEDITRNDGLRDSVLLLLKDTRTRTKFGGLSKDVAVVKDITEGKVTNKPVMTNTNQIESYLATLSEKAGIEEQDWRKLTTPIWNHAIKRPTDYIKSSSPFSQDAGFESLQPGERQRQIDFNGALKTAKKINADEALLRLSARQIEDYHQTQHDIAMVGGNVALHGVNVEVPIPPKVEAEKPATIPQLANELMKGGIKLTQGEKYLGAEITSLVHAHGVRETLVGLTVDGERMVAAIAMSREKGGLEGYSIVEVGKPGDVSGKLLGYVVLSDLQKPVPNETVGQAIETEKTIDITTNGTLTGQYIINAQGLIKYVNRLPAGSIVLTSTMANTNVFEIPRVNEVVNNKKLWSSLLANQDGVA